MRKRKDPAAVARGKARIASMTEEQRSSMGRAGGLKGGPARAQKLGGKGSPRLKAIARKAARALWAKRGKK